jgi:hypothetical protein
MKKSFLFKIITAALFLFSTVGCEKDAPAPEAGGGGKANLTIETVSGPDKEPCGGFNWRVKFNLNEASTKGGWIVQKITYDQNVIKCPSTEFINKKITYWEAWEVEAGAKGDKERLAGKFTFDDQYSSPNFPDTKGSTFITGEVKFFEGAALPASFKKGNKDTYAGDLPATTEEPAFWSSANTASHNLSHIWNCCVANSISVLTTTPALPSPIIVVTTGDSNKLDYTGKLIFRMKAWDYGTTSTELVNTARQVQQTNNPSSLRNSLVNYERTFAGTSEYVAQMSKVYMVLRMMYMLPQSMNSSNAKTFGGWIHPSIANGGNYNMSWPLSVTQSPSGIVVNIDKYCGFIGRGYNAAAELDYFNANFESRNL